MANPTIDWLASNGSTLILSAVTLGLVYFTYRLSMYTRELNKIEKNRDEQRKLDLKVYQLGDALVVANEVLEINAVNLAARISIPLAYGPFLKEVRLLERLRSYSFLLEEKEKLIIERLTNDVLSSCDNARLGGPVPAQDALTAQIKQLIEGVALQVGRLRDERDKCQRKAIGIISVR
jgi:hypothetical protein